ncbi:TetR/AcrR family transcriptional regulator [Actinomadura darangshiensis]|uniref:TetR/AcrR family transcriptional regulator n=1 Tax=Actinomadura darangshiensis TaxID=705336 RepID=A0A4R5ALS3_9ACTN|nr:TetR family transcriptional regulator [Actinomadura darangshiensis]TDD71102.1 TetR/AcrR family transcriptional regulator [Actinomadura darangshiensis]
MAFTERSAPTRTAILTAARRLFADDGYERATIRAIAADAGIDPSMVIRYFGSKADLYAAASAIDLAVPDLGGAQDAAAAYVRSFLARWEAGENTAEAVLLRTAPTRPDAAARVQAIFDEEIVPALRKAIPDAPDVRERAALLLSQTLGIVYCRYLLGIEPLASMDVRDVAAMAVRAAEGHLYEDRGPSAD